MHPIQLAINFELLNNKTVLMKKLSKLMMLFAIVFASLSIMSCEGPEGPEGPAGPTGATGANGKDGKDGSLYCASCHNNTTMNKAATQFATTPHGTFDPAVDGYAGGRNTCAKCHSHQGFVETTFTGNDTTFNTLNLSRPMHMQCETCHDMHTSLDSSEGPDYAMRYKGITEWTITNRVEKTDMPGSANTCAYCHQPRPRPGLPIKPSTSPTTADSVSITSAHWGPHYAPQAAIQAGLFGYEIPGTLPYDNSKHSDKDCAFCHMVKSPKDATKGGHTFVVDRGTCNDCHGTAVNMTTIEAEYHTLLTELEHLLVDNAKGRVLLDAELHPTVGKRSNLEAGAIFNFLMCEYEGSAGVHNTKYVKALLKNTIDALKAAGY